MVSSTVSKKIRTLAKIVQELHQGKDFNITRLTSIKSLCADPKAAEQFFLYLAKLTQKKMEEKAKTSHLEAEDWLDCKTLVNESVCQIEAYLASNSHYEEWLFNRLLSDYCGDVA
ncbi:hypothetical protein Lepto7375DRAFT_5667 [Leptolyngbya sp. PCC 7375]|nr:hypothetical protein Lepto7375DRAFT_5667 [Leptolyngbya sp. PCC 7375]